VTASSLRGGCQGQSYDNNGLSWTIWSDFADSKGTVSGGLHSNDPPFGEAVLSPQCRGERANQGALWNDQVLADAVVPPQAWKGSIKRFEGVPSWVVMGPNRPFEEAQPAWAQGPTPTQKMYPHLPCSLRAARRGLGRICPEPSPVDPGICIDGNAAPLTGAVHLPNRSQCDPLTLSLLL
jgi:hypothetical protein